MKFDLESIIQKITETLKSETVVGESITVGDVTMIPVLNVTFGFGIGAGDDGSQGAGGGGGGGGGRISVVGMMVVKGDEVSFVPTSGKGAGKPSSLEKLLDALPDLLEKLPIKVSKSKEDSKAEESEETKDQEED